MRNQMRDEVLAEFRSRLAWNIRHDKKAVFRILCIDHGVRLAS